jgi:hypothetical protein
MISVFYLDIDALIGLNSDDQLVTDSLTAEYISWHILVLDSHLQFRLNITCVEK